VASFLLQCLITPAIALRFYFIPYEFARLLRIVAISGGLYVCSGWVSSTSLSLALSGKALLLCLYPLLLVLTGFLLPEELLYLRRTARALRSHLVASGNG